MFMIFINEVIKKCLFIQFKCHYLEFVVSNLLCITQAGRRHFLGNMRPSRAVVRHTSINANALRGLGPGAGSLFVRVTWQGCLWLPRKKPAV